MDRTDLWQITLLITHVSIGIVIEFKKKLQMELIY
jgi:hypothetical protein